MHEKQKEIFNKLLAKRASKFVGKKYKIDPNKLIFDFKTEGKIPKDFRNYQMPLKLFKSLRDGDVEPKEILRNQVKFKSDLSEIKIGSNSIFDTCKNIKRSYNNKKFKKSAPTWNNKFELPDRSYSISDIKEYLEYIKKNMEKILIIHQ